MTFKNKKDSEFQFVFGYSLILIVCILSVLFVRFKILSAHELSHPFFPFSIVSVDLFLYADNSCFICIVCWIHSLLALFRYSIDIFSFCFVLF